MGQGAKPAQIEERFIAEPGEGVFIDLVEAVELFAAGTGFEPDRIGPNASMACQGRAGLLGGLLVACSLPKKFKYFADCFGGFVVGVEYGLALGAVDDQAAGFIDAHGVREGMSSAACARRKESHRQSALGTRAAAPSAPALSPPPRYPPYSPWRARRFVRRS